MGSLARAARYLMRKPGKTAILVLVVFAACLMTVASAGVVSGAESISARIKADSRPSVGLYASDGSSITEDDVEGIASRADVACVNRIGTVDVFPNGFDAIEAPVADPGWDGAVRIHAFDDLSQGSPFEDQLVRLSDGWLLSPGDTGAVVLHEELAAAAGVGVGDTVAFRAPDGTRVEAEVVGLFAAAGGNEGEQGFATSRTQSFNQVYADPGTALSLGMGGFESLRIDPADPDGAEALAEDLSADSRWETEVFASAYERLAPSLEAASSTATAVLALVGAVAVAAIAALLALWGRERRHERAVLLSLGVSCGAVALQAAAEAFVVAVVGAIPALAAGRALASVANAALLPGGGAATVPLAESAVPALACMAVPVAVAILIALSTVRKNPVDLLSERR